MADAKVFYQQLFVDVSDPSRTIAFVYLDCVGDCPHTVQGWHSKEFEPTITSEQIIQGFSTREGDPLFWPNSVAPILRENPPRIRIVQFMAQGFDEADRPFKDLVPLPYDDDETLASVVNRAKQTVRLSRELDSEAHINLSIVDLG